MTGTLRDPLRANISRRLAKLPTTFLASNSTPLDERYAFAAPQGPQVGVVYIVTLDCTRITPICMIS